MEKDIRTADWVSGNSVSIGEQSERYSETTQQNIGP
jgi:hypothetical protein